MAAHVKNVNHGVLRQCREQMGLSIEQVQQKVKRIASFESGEHAPTFNQLDILAELYHVPRWVFIADSLPSEYQFNNIPSFRHFAECKAEAFDVPAIRGLIIEVSQSRQLILDILEDMEEPLASFNPPVLPRTISAKAAAEEMREWCGLDINTSFEERRKKLEEKGVFVFLTAKHRGWSHIESNVFRGLSIYHKTLPIIIINDRDAHKALSFTLFHELGHLLRKENALDAWDDRNQQEEKWCDEFSGNILMPEDEFLKITSAIKNIDSTMDVKGIAKEFRVSEYACLVRLRQLDKIDHDLYEKLDSDRNDKYKLVQEKQKTSKVVPSIYPEQEEQKASKGGPPRDRAKEVLRQYGRIYTQTLFQCYYDKEIGLHNLCKLLDIKRVSDVAKLESEL